MRGEISVLCLGWGLAGLIGLNTVVGARNSLRGRGTFVLGKICRVFLGGEQLVCWAYIMWWAGHSLRGEGNICPLKNIWADIILTFVRSIFLRESRGYGYRNTQERGYIFVYIACR